MFDHDAQMSKRKEDREMDDVLVNYWRQFLAGVAFIVWLVRLESKAMSNEKEIKRIREQRNEDLRLAKEARDQTNEMLKEIRTDIKNLIRQA